MSNTQLTNNNPAYTFEVLMDANQFIPVLQQAAEHRETFLHLAMWNSMVSISTGNNLPVLLKQGCRCSTFGIPDDICCNFDVSVDSLRLGYLIRFKHLVSFITIKMVDPRATTQLPPLLESLIEFDELAKINFHYEVQVSEASCVRLPCNTVGALNSPIFSELTIHNYTSINIDVVSAAHLTDLGDPPQNDDVQESTFFTLLKKVAHVEKLSLSLEFLLLLEDLPLRDWPIFPHLRELEFCSSEMLDWSLLYSFLINSPKLEFLALTKELKGKKKQEDTTFVWNPPTAIPTCLKSSLKLVDFDQFWGRGDEQQLVGYLLSHSDVLESIHISTSPYPLTDDLLHKLLKLPITSPKCTVSLS